MYKKNKFKRRRVLCLGIKSRQQVSGFMENGIVNAPGQVVNKAVVTFNVRNEATAGAIMFG